MTHHHDIDHEIRRATADDVTATAQLIAAAFYFLDVSAWLVPDRVERLRVLAADFQIFVEHALAHGEIDLIRHDPNDNNGPPTAVAVWFPQSTGPLSPPEDYDARLAVACGPATTRFQVLDQHFEDTHPHEFPHHYLAYLATRPGWQSGGLGSALLRHHHRDLDCDGISAFLHASCARTRDFYQRHGYHTRGDPFQLPDGPLMWPMWRGPLSPH